MITCSSNKEVFWRNEKIPEKRTNNYYLLKQKKSANMFNML